MASCYTGAKREISYFGPIYINNNCGSLSGNHKGLDGPTHSALALNKYKILPLNGEGKESDDELSLTTIRIDRHASATSVSPVTLSNQIKECRQFTPEGKTRSRGLHDINHVRSRSEDLDMRNVVHDRFTETLDDRDQYPVQDHYRFKISSTEDNYMFNKFKAKSKLIHSKKDEKALLNQDRMDTGKTVSADETGKEKETSENPIKQSTEKTEPANNVHESKVQAVGKDFLSKHRNRINKLKRRFFESHITPTPIPVKNDLVRSENVEEIAPSKPPRSLSKSERFRTNSRTSLINEVDEIFSERRRRHSTDGSPMRNYIEDRRMRWSTGSGQYAVVVAIDFGTTYSGYAYSFTDEPDTIHVMRRHESGDPGVFDQKIPTTILFTPEGQFHSFGYAARDFYHDLDQRESVKWLYYDKFKMMLQNDLHLHHDSSLQTFSGKEMSAMKVFSCSLSYFKELAIQEICDQAGERISCDVIRWVITVPAIWKASAKQFMRQAAYQAGIVSHDQEDQLLIALEPEAASIYCRRLRMFHILSEGSNISSTSMTDFLSTTSLSMPELQSHDVSLVSNDLNVGIRYMVVDCGGGTVDITVHELLENGRLKELQRATGGSHGSVGVDEEFEGLLCEIFGTDLINHFKRRRPTGWIDLMSMFESRKRTASPYRASHIAISIPFSFIDFYKKSRGSSVASAVKQYGDPEIVWTSNGLLKLTPGVMRRLFLPTVDKIKQSIGSILNNPANRDISYMFLVGGFAESSIVQHEMRKDFGSILKIIIPPGMGMTILRGAVYFGQDPNVVNSRCSCLTYGVGVLRRFDRAKHMLDKKVTKDGLDWCTDVFDVFVKVNQSVELGERIMRRYTPVRRDQTATSINIYCTDNENAEYISDPGVSLCGTLSLKLNNMERGGARREIKTEMIFGDTEIRVQALDVTENEGVEATIDFINF